MKLKILTFIIILIIPSVTAFASEHPQYFTASLEINGQTVQCDVPPVIIEDRTLVPARTVFERLGADVTWFEAVRVVEIHLGNTNILLTIDSDEAKVNGGVTWLAVPARIIGGATMIPVRFVAEALGYDVTWNPETQVVGINDKNPDFRVSCAPDGERDIICVKTPGYIEPTVTRLSDPERIILDFAGLNILSGSTSVSVDGQFVTRYRYANHSDKVRLVLDTNGSCNYDIGRDGGLFVIYVHKNPSSSPAPVPAEIKDVELIVVLDAGHGAHDPGTHGGQINEKDVNLDVTLKIEQSLKDAGVNVLTTRDADVFVELYERAGIANRASAILFLSVHCNSATPSEASGFEVWYFPGEAAPEYGISSQQFAEIAAQEMAKELDMKNRGLKKSTGLVVLKATDMPAILVELGFMSNPGDLSKLDSEDYRQKMANALTNAVIKALTIANEKRVQD